MSRSGALARAYAHFDQGGFLADLARRVAFATESQNPDRGPEFEAYLSQEMTPSLEGLGFVCRVFPNPHPAWTKLAFLIGERLEDPGLPTLLTYGHGDTVRGMAGRWRDGLDPWRVTVRGERWYGRGTSDNKGQHSLNLAALAAVLAERGSLGFNVKILLESGEESGSPGLHEFCRRHREELKADLLIGSDGPRLAPNLPTVYGGSRGVANYDLRLTLRQGGHHSGNWGGLLANPGTILANAIAALVDGQGRILVPELKAPAIPESVKRALAVLPGVGEGGPEADPAWGEPGLSLAEKVFAANTLEVLAFTCGDPAAPAHAIPPSAYARLHLRFVVGSRPEGFQEAIQRRLAERGFGMIEVTPGRENYTQATRLDPDHPWVGFTLASLEKTSGKRPVYLPNLGGTLPNDAFSDVLGLPTVWIPHSYGGCSQHAPDEHVLAPLTREALGLMAGLFWDLGELPRPWPTNPPPPASPREP